MPEDTVRPLSAAADRAPDRAGVYAFLAADTELLYVGKARSLRRRLRQHAGAKPGAGGRRLDVLYERVAEVRWQELPDEAAAAMREADLIAALHPLFNAGSMFAGTWNYIVVEPALSDRSVVRFALVRDAAYASGGPGRTYGCFPHLGRGIGTPPGVACSDGYAALLRLLWAASDAQSPSMPNRITRSAPDEFQTPLDPAMAPALHDFLSGTSHRLLDRLESAYAFRAAYLKPGLERDRKLAERFYAHGPVALRKLRLRHGRKAGPMSRAVIEQVLTTDLRQAIGEFRLPAAPSESDEILGRRSQPWTRHPGPPDEGRSTGPPSDGSLEE